MVIRFGLLVDRAIVDRIDDLILFLLAFLGVCSALVCLLSSFGFLFLIDVADRRIGVLLDTSGLNLDDIRL